MELPKLESMSVWQIIGKSFRLYLKNFWWFLGMAIVVYLPLTGVRLIFKLYELSEMPGTLSDWQSLPSEVAPWFAIRMLSQFVSFLLSIAIFRKISANHLGSQVAFGETYRFAWSKFKTAFMASLLFFIVFVPFTLLTLLEKLEAEPTGSLGTIITLAFLPVSVITILVGIWFAVTPQCIAATNLSAWQSMKQSKALVKGNMGRVIALGVLLMISVIGIYLIVWPVDLLLVHLWQSVFTESNIVVSFRPTMTGILFSTLTAVTFSLLYYDLRARKRCSEGETIEDVADELNQGEEQTQLKKPRISRLAIASVVLGLSALISALCESWGIPGLILRDALSYFAFWGIPGLILGISAVIVIKKSKGLLRGRVLAWVGIGISCLAMYLSS